MVKQTSEARQRPVEKVARTRQDIDGLVMGLAEPKDTLETDDIVFFAVDDSGSVVDGGWLKSLDSQTHQKVDTQGMLGKAKGLPATGPLMGQVGREGSTKGEAAHPALGPHPAAKLGLPPLPAGPEIFLLSVAMVVAALACTHASKIGSQADQASSQKASGHGLNDLVVEASAKERVGVGDQGQPNCGPDGLVNGQFEFTRRSGNLSALGLCVQGRLRLNPQSLNRGLTKQVRLDNFLNVRFVKDPIPDALGVDHQHWTIVAAAHAARTVDANLAVVVGTKGLEAVFGIGLKGRCTGLVAAVGPRLTLVDTEEDVFVVVTHGRYFRPAVGGLPAEPTEPGLILMRGRDMKASQTKQARGQTAALHEASPRRCSHWPCDQP